MNAMSSDFAVQLPAERHYLQDAERRLTNTIRSSIVLVAVIVLFSVAFLYLTHDHAAAIGADSPQRAMRRWLVVAAALAYGCVKAAVRIRKARTYVTASQRALEEFEEQAKRSDEGYSG